MIERILGTFVLATLATALPAAATAMAKTPAEPQEMGDTPAIATVTLPSAGSPLVAIRLLFKAGSIDDPKGKEGLAALTGLMVAQAGTTERSYGELIDALYPMAASIDVATGREVTVVSGLIHRDKLADYTALVREAVLHPGFAKSDFERNKEQLLAYLTTTLRSSSDELLGLEAIQDEIFAGHPYGHPPEGTVQGLGAITLDDVKAFYKAHYTRAALLLGVAGGYPADYPAKLAAGLADLPAGKPGLTPLPDPPKVEGRSFTLIDKQTASVGIHFGYPLAVTRADPDYYPLMVANSFLGEHRTSHGQLMQELREKRGLNYGDYSYIEYWDNPPRTNSPTPNFPRRQQYFSVWVRPVVPGDAHFALRAALYEVGQLAEKGMTEEQFELSRDFLIHYSKLWAQTLSDRLGFLMDSRYYGMPYYIDEIGNRLGKLTVDDVNKAIRKYIRTDRYDAVFVTGNAGEVKAYLETDDPSPKTYNSAVSDEVKETDKAIVKLEVRPTSVRIVPASEIFEK